MSFVKFILIALAVFPLDSFAHKPSDSYLFLQEEASSLSLRWDIALRDLQNVIPLDSNEDRKITWGELRSHQAEVFNYALNHLTIRQGMKHCSTTTQSLQVEKHNDGQYAVLNIALDCPETIKDTVLEYRLFADIDPSHRGILLDQRVGHESIPFVLGSDSNQLKLDTTSDPQADRHVFVNYIVEGIWHIWIGLDHILFILGLIFPFVLALEKQASPRKLIAIISAFTLAHSLTLSLAVLGWVNLPTRWVETAIAVSIIFTAWNNLSSRFNFTRWKLAFAFGLLHGFGFASVLIDLGLPAQSIAYSLFGFNVGVEVGQLVILLCVFPLPLILMKNREIRIWSLHHGSLLAIAVAFLWGIERSLNFDFGLTVFSVLALLVYIFIQRLYAWNTSSRIMANACLAEKAS